MISPSPRLPDTYTGADTLAPRGPVAEAGPSLPRTKLTCICISLFATNNLTFAEFHMISFEFNRKQTFSNESLNLPVCVCE